MGGSPESGGDDAVAFVVGIVLLAIAFVAGLALLQAQLANVLSRG